MNRNERQPGPSVGSTGDAPSARAQLESLFTEVEAPLTNVLYRWVWSRDEADDLVQEAFLRLWRMRDRVDWERARPLVYKIALNLASSQRRRRSLLKWVSLGDSGEPHAAEPDASVALERSQEERAVRRAIDALPERQRRALVMTTFTDMTYEDIGAALGVSAGTIGSRRNTAVRKVADAMSRWEHSS